MSDKKKLVVIDGFNFLFRAYYAVRTLTRSDGLPTNALYGFTQMLLKVIEDVSPDYLTVAIDTPRTFRHDIFPDYKGHRKEPDEEILQQIPYLEPLIQAFGIQTMKLDNYEADDLIAALAHKHGGECEVVIVSSDKDLMQLVNNDVYMYDTMKDLFVHEAQVFDKFSVTPDKVIEVQSLIGDSSDNIPGVKGIGPKNAALLIQEFGSIENLYDNIEKVQREKLKITLIENKELAFISKRLVTLDLETPLDKSLEDLLYKPHPENTAAYLSKMEFNRLKTRAVKLFSKNIDVEHVLDILEDENPNKVLSDAKYETINSEEGFQKWLNLLDEYKIFAIDTETTSLHVMQANLVGISLSVKGGEACYIPLTHKIDMLSGDYTQLDKGYVLKALKLYLEDSEYTKIGQNIKYDMHIFYNEGIEIKGFEDTMLMSACLDGGLHNHGMDDLAKRHLDHTCTSFKEIAGTGKKQKTFDEIPIEDAAPYAAEDADITFQLYTFFKNRLNASENEAVKNLYETIEKPLVPILMQMEHFGVRVDRSSLENLSVVFEERIRQHEKHIFELSGEEFNVNSPKQLGEVLFDKLGIETKGKKRSTNAEILNKLASEYEICAEVVKFRALMKLKGTYTESLVGQINPKTGRVHTSYHQIGAATGRFSSSDPNLQNIPSRTEDGRKIRHCFVPSQGCVLMCADYSQIELRLLAHLSKSEGLVKAFKDGEDIHSFTAAQIFNVDKEKLTPTQRSAAKAINFGLVYGMGKVSLAKQIGVTQKEAAEYIESYFERYGGVRKFLEGYKEMAHDKGYIETLLGRRVHFPNINAKQIMLKAGAERAAINAPLQGSNADIIKKAMISMQPELEKVGLKAKMIMQVHDELVLEVPKDEIEKTTAVVKEVMENVVSLDVPLKVDVGVAESWEAAH
jgi:DNA polymerase-1